jgi:hypothetical protein
MSQQSFHKSLPQFTALCAAASSYAFSVKGDGLWVLGSISDCSEDNMCNGEYNISITTSREKEQE